MEAHIHSFHYLKYTQQVILPLNFIKNISLFKHLAKITKTI